jgi:sec-independent protein translocase protein TatA
MLGAMIGGLELIVIIVVILLIFGPAKLPQLGEGIGKMLRGFRKELKQIEQDKREEDTRRGGEIDVTPKDDKSTKYSGPG